jgi:hypothetical protein
MARRTARCMPRQESRIGLRLTGTPCRSGVRAPKQCSMVGQRSDIAKVSGGRSRCRAGELAGARRANLTAHPLAHGRHFPRRAGRASGERMKRRVLFVCASLACAAAACSSQRSEPQQPPPQQQQPYYYPPPPPPEPPPPAAPPPAEAPPPATAPPATPDTTTAPPATTGTPTAIPGVTKNPDGTCSLANPAGPPLTGPCRPGI